MATSHTRANAPDHCIMISRLLKNDEIVQVHLTLEVEGSRSKETILYKRSTWQTMDNV